MKDILCVFGAVFLLGIFIGATALFFMWLREVIDNAIWQYKYKHRFDKSPTAKCYCIDCKYRRDYPTNHYCTRVSKCVGDSWFCWEADPRPAGERNTEN